MQLNVKKSNHNFRDEAEEQHTSSTAQEQKETGYSTNLFKAVKKGVIAALMGSASSITDSDYTKSAATSTTGIKVTVTFKCIYIYTLFAVY